MKRLLCLIWGHNFQYDKAYADYQREQWINHEIIPFHDFAVCSRCGAVH